MPEVFVTYPELRPQHGIRYTRLHLNRLEKRGLFPKARWLTSNRKCWLLSEIEEWKRTRSIERPPFPFEGAGDAAAD
jgi:predicted DNA-binding transcriptional regulator AlpA